MRRRSGSQPDRRFAPINARVLRNAWPSAVGLGARLGRNTHHRVADALRPRPRKGIRVTVKGANEVEIDNPKGGVKVLKVERKKWVLAASATRGAGVVEHPGPIATVLVDP